MARDRAPLDPAALARARGALASAQGRRRLDVILDHPRPAALVRALPADDLYFTIRDIGLADAAPLVQLAGASQFRAFLDLACWEGEVVDPRRALPWLRAARSGALDSPRASARWKAKLARLDPEMVILVLRDALRVHELDDEGEVLGEEPAEDNRVMRTPEGRFLLEFVVEGAEYQAVRGVVDDLYAEDPFQATRLLSAIRAELPSELAETALRWRAGRLADLGYPDRQEALAWFTRPPSGALASPAGTPSRPPGFWLERLGQGSLLASGAAALGQDERDHLELELVAAANAVMVADAVDAGDAAAAREAVEVARSLVELGLEAEAGRDAERAGEVLARTAVKALFQRGFGRLLDLGSRAARLLPAGEPAAAGSPPTQPPSTEREGGAPRLDAPLGELLAALARRRPLYFPGVELPRERWGAPEVSAALARPFRSSAEVARAEEALALAEGLVALAARLGLTARGDGAAGVSLARLYLTALAHERLGGDFVPEPIPAASVGAAAEELRELHDPRLEAEGEPGRLLASMARAAAEELEPLRAGLVPAGWLPAAFVVE